MSRSTPADEAFKRAVATEFSRARDRALKQNLTVEQFVQTLGITRAAFHKYVTRQAIPSLRVLANARKYWNVKLQYRDLGDRYIKTRKEKDPRQMEFQFSIQDISKEQIEIKKFSPRGDKAVELLIKIDLSKSA